MARVTVTLHMRPIYGAEGLIAWLVRGDGDSRWRLWEER